MRPDLVHHFARQRAELFPGLDDRAGDDDLLDPLLVQRLGCRRTNQPGLAHAGRTDSEDQFAVLDGIEVDALGVVPRHDGTAVNLGHDRTLEGGQSVIALLLQCGAAHFALAGASGLGRVGLGIAMRLEAGHVSAKRVVDDRLTITQR
ncbi:hypothetical protein FQZ97_925310 [compost metagenome]